MRTVTGQKVKVSTLTVCVTLFFYPPSQEGVSLGKYSPLEVTVETDNGTTLCRTYQINNFYACPPSPQYKRVGAPVSTASRSLDSRR